MSARKSATIYTWQCQSNVYQLTVRKWHCIQRVNRTDKSWWLYNQKFGFLNGFLSMEEGVGWYLWGAVDEQDSVHRQVAWVVFIWMVFLSLYSGKTLVYVEIQQIPPSSTWLYQLCHSFHPASRFNVHEINWKMDNAVFVLWKIMIVNYVQHLFDFFKKGVRWRDACN